MSEDFVNLRKIFEQERKFFPFLRKIFEHVFVHQKKLPHLYKNLPVASHSMTVLTVLPHLVGRLEMGLS